MNRIVEEAFAKLDKYDGADIQKVHDNYMALMAYLPVLNTSMPEDRLLHALPIWLAECIAYKFSVAQGGKTLEEGAIEVAPTEPRHVYGRYAQTESRSVMEMKDAVFDHMLERYPEFQEEWKKCLDWMGKYEARTRVR